MENKKYSPKRLTFEEDELIENIRNYNKSYPTATWVSSWPFSASSTRCSAPPTRRKINPPI